MKNRSLTYKLGLCDILFNPGTPGSYWRISSSWRNLNFQELLKRIYPQVVSL